MSRHDHVRRGAWLGAGILALIGLGAGLASCTLFDPDLPDRSCKVNNECFGAQGEYCDPDRHVCAPAPDAAPEAPDAEPPDAEVTP